MVTAKHVPTSLRSGRLLSPVPHFERWVIIKMITRNQILNAAKMESELHRRIHITCAIRYQGDAAMQAWHDATNAWHARSSEIDYLWGDDFMEQVRLGDRQAMEDALVYLEVDPWYHRSGYLKERLIRAVKRAPLNDRDMMRLRNVVWNVAHGMNRREFRNYCSLALRIRTPQFESMLDDISDDVDLRSKGKISFLRNYLNNNKV